MTVEPLRVLGIDPGLANLGLAVLYSPRPGDYQVLADNWALYSTMPRDALLDRLRELHDHVRWFTEWCAPVDAIVVESPVGRSGPTAQTKGQRKSPRDISAQGIATGVELAVALDFPGPVAFIDANDWYPKTRTGNREHFMRREQATRYLREVIAFPPSLAWSKYEHVVMAAGVARRWIDDERLRRRRTEQGVTI